jgi:hypothetical protein
MGPWDNAMAYLERITIYPIKSLDGLDLAEAVVLPGGALAHDRQFALVDADGGLINAKRTDRVHRVRARFDLSDWTVELGVEGEGDRLGFHLDGDRTALEAWLSDRLGQPVSLIDNPVGGFPDDTDSPGPTLVSRATLETVTHWFPDLDLAEVQRRFRANLEIGGVEPFWEDHLCGASHPGTVRVGEVALEGTNPCARCVVPSRSSSRGDVTPEFAKRFSERREATLPPWADRSRFDHFYRLAVNTRLATGESGVVRVGDPVQFVEPE